MHAMVRTYSGQGAAEIFDLIEQRQDDLKSLIGGVPGFISYAALRTAEGGTTVTVCEEKEGTDESARRAAQWVKENATESPSAPTITEGTAVLQF